MKKILALIFLTLVILVAGCTGVPNQKCGIEQCHGLEVTCGPNVPDVCTEIAMLGDGCRQYASCEVVDGECKLLASEEFEECKECIGDCIGNFETEDVSNCANTCLGLDEEPEEVEEPMEEIKTGPCSEPIKFDYAPSEIDKLLFILPLGHMSGNHVTPVDHQYYWTDSDEHYLNVYSPADGVITDIQHMGSIPGDDVTAIDDYRITIKHICSISSIFIHIDELSDKLMKVAPPLGEYTSTSLEVDAGEIIGRFSGSLDYAIIDYGVELEGFVFPESYTEPWKSHTPDPINYFNEPWKSKMIAKSIRTAEPIGGKIDYDIEGKLVGTWFKEGTKKYDGLEMNSYWVGHMTIAYDSLDPSHIVVSIGGYDGDDSMQFGVVGNSPDPADVGIGNGMIKYELVYFNHYDESQEWNYKDLAKGLEAKNRDDVQGVALFQVLEDNKLKMEVFPNKKGLQVSGFTSGALVYER